jgi:hypothetical protein
MELQQEVAFFEKNREEYLKAHKGRFVLIKGEQFKGAFSSEAEAYKQGLAEFGNEPFLIKLVSEGDLDVSFPALLVGLLCAQV